MLNPPGINSWGILGCPNLDEATLNTLKEMSCQGFLIIAQRFIAGNSFILE